MIRKTPMRARWAALTSGALVAGGLVVAPAVAGLSAATAAPIELGYTCTVSGAGQSKALDSTISLDVTVPDASAPGANVPATIAATLNMGSSSFGPVQGLTAAFDVPLTVGGTTTVITLEPVSAQLSNLVFTTTGAGNLKAPATPGAAPITVGDITSNLTTVPDFGIPATAACVPDAAQDQTVGQLNVEQGTDPDPVAVPVTGVVKVSGTPKVGKVLKATPGTTDGATVTYRWLANGKAIAKATKPSLKLTKVMRGKKISVRATYTKSGYEKVVQTSKAVTVKK